MTATGLERRSLFYRRPDLYDQARGEPDEIIRRLVENLTADYAPQAQSVLDLGCGTGRDVAELAGRFDCVGIELQPQIVAYARQARPHLDIRAGDMRTVRLGRPVDAILCVGNALAYLHTNDDISAAFTTFATHAHPGTLLVIQTAIAPTLTDSDIAGQRVDTGELQGTCHIRHEWNPTTQINTVYRHWRLDDGTEHQDEIARRVTSPPELEQHASQAGFEPLETFTDPTTRTGPMTGGAGWFIARYRP